MSWTINLARPPEVVAIATNIHGFQPSERFLLPGLWSLHLYRYSGQLVVEGKALSIQPGYAGVIPPAVENEYRYKGLSAHLYVHFRIPTDGEVQESVHQSIPIMQDLGGRFSIAYTRLSEVIDCPYKLQVNARVWDLLWELAIPPKILSEVKVGHASVELVTRLIEERLGQPLTVSQLALEADITPSYLTYLFRKAHGDSVLGYIRKKRIDRALHLLKNSTLPIKSIASSVGYFDLQHFNKAVRAASGLCPRSTRSGNSVAP